MLTCPKLVELELDLGRVHGQASGISTDYFLMNVGDTMRVKPDRWVIGFLVRALGHSISQTDAQLLFQEVCPLLKTDYPGITPRALDLAVWESEAKWRDNAPEHDTATEP